MEWFSHWAPGRASIAARLPERKRRLWRLWLSDPELRPATAYVRQWDAGVVLRATEDRIVL